MKKLLSIILAASMLTAMTTTAFAAEPVMPDSNGNVSIGKDEITIGIEGRVEPIGFSSRLPSKNSGCLTGRLSFSQVFLPVMA